MLTNALLVNGLVLFAVLEADLGSARKLSRFRMLRPLLLAAGIVPMFLGAVATHGMGLRLELAGAATGMLLGFIALQLIHVRRDPKTGGFVTRAGGAYAALWIVVIAARSAFSIGSLNWFNGSLTTWLTQHQVTGSAVTDTLIFMAIAMTLTRTIGLSARARKLRSSSSSSSLAMTPAAA